MTITHHPWRTVLAIDHCPKACEVYRANLSLEGSSGAVVGGGATAPTQQQEASS